MTTLHLTTAADYSRVDLRLDGVLHRRSVWGPHHRDRSLAHKVRQALTSDPTTAPALLAT